MLDYFELAKTLARLEGERVMSKANEAAYPHPYLTPNGGFTKREAYAKDFIAAWIIALGQRHNEPGYSDWGVVAEATRLGLAQADVMLMESEKPHD